jgi:hypothetical protein
VRPVASWGERVSHLAGETMTAETGREPSEFLKSGSGVYLTGRRSSFAVDECIVPSKSQGKFNTAVIPPYADSFLSVLCCVNSGHRARLFPLVLNIVAHRRSFATHVWHSSLRIEEGHGNVPAQNAVTVAFMGCFKQKHLPRRSVWVKRNVTAAYRQNPIPTR